MENILEITDEAILKLLEKKEKEQFNYIRLGITGGGCAGFEYIFDSVSDKDDNDIVVDFGKLQFVIDKVSLPYINGMTLDYVKEGLNEVFKFKNPKEQSSCGCGVSINFDLEQVKVDESKIFAIEL
jgi:iron-sulfur cluster assembly accessory protein|tara:strand:+ start:141 stop:518 length:378 start_codon:yes stop_codon:yes gene_type:complete